MSDSQDFNFTSCKCGRCVNMCETNPCLPIPGDILNLLVNQQAEILNGFEVVDLYDFEMVKPRRQENGHCHFLKGGLCQLHDKGFKPFEGKAIDCNSSVAQSVQIHNHAAAQWRVIGTSIIRFFRGRNEPR